MIENISWHLDKDLEVIRQEFPILGKNVYLVSNSLGAVPEKSYRNLMRYYDLWASEGVSAWGKEWWDLAGKIGNRIASFLNAGSDEITMLTSATHCHWIALSTKFKSKESTRNKIVMTDQDFPSSAYAVHGICDFMGWEVDLVRSESGHFLDVQNVLDRIDEKTLFVATSHIYFKSAYIQDIAIIAAKARDVGALTLIDGYHAPGCYPVDLEELSVDFYIGGCLKWLCGGPGAAFLYVRPDLTSTLEPGLTGWLAHRNPFGFSDRMEITSGSYKFMSGTPAVPSLYTAMAGLDVIDRTGIEQIRRKSLRQTGLIINCANQRSFTLYTPEENSRRGGSVSVSLPHAFQIKQALDEKHIKVDFRKGIGIEPDVIRIGPHFYNRDEEIEELFREIDAIHESKEYKKYPSTVKHVT